MLKNLFDSFKRNAKTMEFPTDSNSHTSEETTALTKTDLIDILQLFKTELREEIKSDLTKEL